MNRGETHNKTSVWPLVVVVALVTAVAVLVGSRWLIPMKPASEPAVSSASVDRSVDAVQGLQKDRLAEIEEQLALLQDRLDATVAGQGESPTPKAALEQRMRELENRVAEQRRTDKAAEQDRAALQVAVNDPALQRKYRQYVEQHGQRRHAHIGDAFQGEAIDPSWAPNMTAQISNAFSASGVEGARLKNADCRASMCRVEYNIASSSVAASDPTASMRLHTNLIRGFAESGDVQLNTRAEPDGNGGYEYVTYIARNGEDLPRTPSELDGLSIAEAIDRLRQRP